MVEKQRGLAGGQCVCCFCRRHGLGNRKRRRRLEVRNRMGGQRRRHLTGLHRHPVVAVDRGRDQFQQQGFDDLAQRPGRFGKRELYVLCLRRPNHLHGKQLWRNQLRGAHVGRVHCAGQPAVGCQWRTDYRFYQPDDLFAERDLRLWLGIPRHHEWHFGQLFGGDWL